MERNRLKPESRELVRSRIPNYNALSNEEQTLAAIKVIAEDFYLFCEKNLMIVDKDGDLIPFVLNWAQKVLVERVLDDIANGRPVRYIVLKARQMGTSTVIEALCYWWTSTHRNVRSIIMAHEKEAARSIYKMFRRFFDNCDPMFKPTRRVNTREDLSFDVEDHVKRDYEEKGLRPPGLGSEIRTVTAADGKGRGDTLRFFHGCLHKDSLVVLADGSSKRIEDISVGDRVYTSSGAIAPVSFKTMTGVKQTYKVNTWMCNEPIIASKDHKILTQDGYKKTSELTSHDWVAKPRYRFEHCDEWVFTLPERKRPQNGGTARETTRRFDMSHDFGYLVGYYLAEGHISKNLSKIVFTYEKNEIFVNRISQFFPNPPREIDYPGSNRKRTEFNSVFMASALESLCGRVESKHVPMFGNDDFYSGLVEGYLDGDGSKTDSQRIRATSIHERIARNINRIQDVFGRHGSLHYSSKRMRYDVQTKPTWTNSFCHGSNSKYKFVDRQCFVRVKSVEEYEVAETYDLEVDHPDHNFETPSGIVSNSEVAFWDNGADIVSSTMQAIPFRKNTFAFLESTANGIGGYFYTEWQNAKQGKSNFKPLFFPWYRDPEYFAEGKITEYDEEEQELREIFAAEGIPKDQWDGKLLWRRAKRREFTKDPMKWYQEYPKDDQEAFLASGRPVFDIPQLVRMEKEAENAEPPRYAQLSRDGFQVKATFVKPTAYDPEPSPLKVWEIPIPGRKYVAGIDVAEGIERGLENKGGDYSVIDVIDVENHRTVARWRGHIDPDLLGHEANLIGTWYNFALIGCEVNNHGLTTIQALRNDFYTNLYMRETAEDEQFQERTSRMGWQTNVKTKPLMINELARAIRENDIIDVDPVFIRECMTYVRDDRGRTNAQEGMYDDTVIAKAIALQMADWSSYNTDNLRISHLNHEERSERTRRTRSRQNSGRRSRHSDDLS